jgi:uncharacterized protein YbjT (DUF2867 family)
MTVLVTAATGAIGAQVVHALHDRGIDVRAFVRDRDKAARVLAPDVEVVVGDYADPDSLARALRGVERVFLACGNVPEQVAHEKAVIDAASLAGVQRVVKLSGPRASLGSTLVFERWHGAIEQHLRASGLPWVMLRPSTYMTNLLAYAEPIARTGMLFAPAGAAKISFVHPRDVAAAAAVALTEPGHEGETYSLTGPAAITFAQIADDLTAATGRRITYVDVPDDAAREAMLDAGLPEFAAGAIVDIFRSQRAGAMTDTTDAVRTLTGHDATPFCEFADEFAGAFGAEQRAAV